MKKRYFASALTCRLRRLAWRASLSTRRESWLDRSHPKRWKPFVVTMDGRRAIRM